MRILIPEMNTINKMYLYLTATTARSHRATSDISVKTAFDGVRDWFLIFFFLSYLITTACVVPRGRASVFCVRKGVILKLVSRLQFFKDEPDREKSWSPAHLGPLLPSQISGLVSYWARSSPRLHWFLRSQTEFKVQSYNIAGSVQFVSMANDSTPVASLSNENWLKNVASRTSEITTGS